MQIQGLPTKFGPGGNHQNKSGVAGSKPADTAMEADVAGSDQKHKRGSSEQPERGGDGMNVDDRRHGRLLVEIVAQIEAEADTHEEPEDGKPDHRSPAIVTRGPG